MKRDIPVVHGSYVHYGGVKMMISLGGMWQYRLYDGALEDCYHTDKLGDFKRKLSECDEANIETKSIFWYKINNVTEDSYILESKWIYFSFTTTDLESYLRDNKSTIDSYVNKKLNDILQSKINKKMEEFKARMKSDREYISSFIGSLGELTESKDLFMGEVSTQYAENFKLIIESFTDTKLKSKIKALFNNFK